MNELAQLTQTLRDYIGLAHKKDISAVVETLSKRMPNVKNDVTLGDDCAVISDNEGFLLFAAEGFLESFLTTQPWFAGYCGVMVNVSDIYAMGGRPIAVVDTIWSNGQANANPVLDGLLSASNVYQVPIVGGHSNMRNDHLQLSVAILGRANKLLSSFAAKAGQKLLVAVDLRGRFHEPYAWWDASTNSPAQRLREDLELLPQLAESELCEAAKDISMAGTIGTILMLLECSRLGGVIDVSAIPRPENVSLERWLTCFPSYGFVLSVDEKNANDVIARFTQRDIACAVVGKTDDSKRLRLTDNQNEELFWDLNNSPLMGCGKFRGESYA
ncbi:MAG: sll0787 family AIR synthase-like protein [Methylococcales bacterium]|nr:sll0787 family AIR synthase-like protein [Methylococcales bacterium]